MGREVRSDNAAHAKAARGHLRALQPSELRSRAPAQRTQSYPQEYKESTSCVNLQLTRLVDKVIARDPGAILIFLSDHGSGFARAGERPLDQWSDEMIAERFPSFVAVRVPEPCR